MTKAIVYLVASPESGLHRRIYDDEHIQALGGIHAIEALLEKKKATGLPGWVKFEVNSVRVDFATTCPSSPNFPNRLKTDKGSDVVIRLSGHRNWIDMFSKLFSGQQSACLNLGSANGMEWSTLMR